MRVEQDAASGREEIRKAWNDRAARMAKDFDLLRTFLGSDDERTYHHEGTVAFATYRRLAATGGGIDREVRGAAERTATGIDRMLGATYAALDEAQVEARQLEERTWNACPESSRRSRSGSSRSSGRAPTGCFASSTRSSSCRACGRACFRWSGVGWTWRRSWSGPSTSCGRKRRSAGW